MIVRCSESTRNAIMQLLGVLIDNGNGAGRIELLAGDEKVLSVLRFSKPSVESVEAGELSFAPIAEDASARATGRAVEARITDADDNEVFVCDVTDPKGDGVIKLNTTSIVAGGPVRIRSFTLTMPG